MNNHLRSTEIDNLFKAILSLETMEECYGFFEDICTINEMKSIAQRVQVGKLLMEGKTYLDIAELTGASPATISRVKRAISYGTGVSEEIIKRAQNDESNTENNEQD